MGRDKACAAANELLQAGEDFIAGLKHDCECPLRV
jgi:hypothetical protein